MHDLFNIKVEGMTVDWRIRRSCVAEGERSAVWDAGDAFDRSPCSSLRSSLIMAGSADRILPGWPDL
jgi:hypothetical protein